ncbi:aminodeoxychorismate/anthranilate synthase component II [Aureispira]|nr:aminodeoxychorismate/anthranilate synthase component II [Aureispira sp.]
MKILIIDNYDSFTYNLVQYLREGSSCLVEVFRNDQIEIRAIAKYDAIVLSPGPGLPKDAGLLLEIIKTYAESKPILGICLGHQAIAQAFGAQLENLTQVYHGIATPVSILKQKDIFKNQQSEISVGRYHSWIVDKKTIPDCLEVIAEDKNGQIMAVQHKRFPVTGLQFHPESVLTPNGKELLKNFINLIVNCHLKKRQSKRSE